MQRCQCLRKDAELATYNGRRPGILRSPSPSSSPPLSPVLPHSQNGNHVDPIVFAATVQLKRYCTWLFFFRACQKAFFSQKSDFWLFFQLQQQPALIFLKILARAHFFQVWFFSCRSRIFGEIRKNKCRLSCHSCTGPRWSINFGACEIKCRYSDKPGCLFATCFCFWSSFVCGM